MLTFRKLGFDIAYLALLTKEQVKPLSRWEGKFSRRQVKALQYLGLKTDTVQRKLLNGGITSELIFSTSSRYLNLYSWKYHQAPITKDQQTVKTEGFLFGYPSCCVHNFAEHGYTDNKWVGRGQEILFHWACPECRATPELLPYYRRAHDRCREMLMAQKQPAPKRLKQSLPAASLAFLFALIPGWARADDPHWYSPSAIDTAGNFIDDREELLLGTTWGYPIGAVPHGPRKAANFRDLIGSLPTAPSDTCCYLEEVPMDGVENCLICGQEMTMGGWVLHNPMQDTSAFISNMALHYMEHGSFSFDGTTNAGRVDIEQLKSILAHYDIDHYAIATTNDADNDGLRDDHESHFGTLTGDADSDDNKLVDGAQVAEHFIEVISQLPVIDSPGSPAPDDTPYILYEPVYGIEDCDICGMTINMGHVIITNPLNDTSINFPIIGLHYLAHGRFAYGGSVNSGEIDAVELANVLDTQTWIPHSHPQPQEYRLNLTTYPNPFNASTRIEFDLPTAGHTAVRIYNINGQLVRKLLDDHLSAGDHFIGWNGQDETGWLVASGIYFCRLEHEGAAKVTKMLLVK